jgi:hypothetical protein
VPNNRRVTESPALRRLAGWSAVANAVVALLSGIALAAFFAIGEPYGTISDIGSILFGLTLLAPAWWLFRTTRPSSGSIGLAVLGVGGIGMLGLAVVQLLFVVGVIAAFDAAIPFTGLIGAWFVLVGLAMPHAPAWPAWLRWAAVLAGIGLAVSVAGLWLGTTHPLTQTAYAVGAIGEIVWAVGFGVRLLRARATGRASVAG